MGKSYFSLRDPIVADSIDAIESVISVSPVIAGGMAIQMHALEFGRLSRTIH
jgi:hypothetical protein